MIKAARQIYFVQLSTVGPIKIGYTQNLERRLEYFKTYSPYAINVLAAASGNKDVEMALHRKFALFRTSGEWFQDVPVIRDEIAAVIAEGDDYLLNTYCFKRIGQAAAVSLLSPTSQAEIATIREDLSMMARHIGGTVGVGDTVAASIARAAAACQIAARRMKDYWHGQVARPPADDYLRIKAAYEETQQQRRTG